MTRFSEVRWGIIGVGDVTEVKSGPAFYKVAHSQLVAVMRRDAAKAADYAQRHRVPRWYGDADALIHDPEVDAVYIATPPDSHAPYALRVADAGKPCYVEKPMALHYAECTAMVDAFEKRGLPLWVAYYRRCLPSFLKVKSLIDEGALGAVRAVNVRLVQPVKPADREGQWRVRPEVSGGGHFHDLASHQFDFLDFLLGPVAEVRGLTGNQAGLYAAEDIVTAAFRFESGVLGSGTWCFTAAPGAAEDTVEIIGDRGKVTFSSFASAPVQFMAESGPQAWLLPYPPHVQQPMIQTIVDELRGVGQCPSTGATAARTSRVLDWVTGRG
ncbi:MAG: Gfo/Idh/MocA family oxidoreductase [Cytophagales bacterium]|nr:Gfo/Idh/MocA family oxidoreductase [Cytophagales bacterium]